MDSWAHFSYKILLYKVVYNEKQISSISQYVYWYSSSDEFKFLTIYRNDSLLIQNETLSHFTNMSTRSSRPEQFCKKAVPEKHLCQSLFLNKSQAEAYKFIKKETLTQVLSCEFWEMFKNTLLIEYLRATISHLLKMHGKYYWLQKIWHRLNYWRVWEFKELWCCNLKLQEAFSTFLKKTRLLRRLPNTAAAKKL